MSEVRAIVSIASARARSRAKAIAGKMGQYKRMGIRRAGVLAAVLEPPLPPPLLSFSQ
jgi:hypothetical protein